MTVLMNCSFLGPSSADVAILFLSRTGQHALNACFFHSYTLRGDISQGLRQLSLSLVQRRERL